jgi:tetratricopeptide (TPR) repeat protein
MRLARALKLWTALTFIGIVAIGRFGLLDQLGYDLSAAVAVLTGVSVPHLAACTVADSRASRRSRSQSAIDFVMATYLRTVVAAGGLLLVPLIVVAVRGIWVPHCDFGGGLAWYFLLPGVTALYAAALGIFFGLAAHRTRSALFFGYGFIALTFVVALRHMIADPPIFFFNGILGYFPGPIYDEGVRITRALLWARAGTLVWSALFLALAMSFCDVRRQKLDTLQFLELDFSFENLTPRLTAVMCILVLFILHVERQETGTSPDAAHIQKTLGGRVESDHFLIYHDRNLAPRDVDLLVEDHEFRLAQLCRALGWSSMPMGRKIRSYVYPSEETKKELMGAAGTSFADPWEETLHLNAAGFPHPVLKHELAHIVSARFAGFLKFNVRIGLEEGFAVAADWEEERLTPDQWAAIMKREQLLPDLESLVSALGFWTEAPQRAYLASGSFVRHLMLRYGPDAFMGFFRDNDYEKHFGSPLDALHARWLAVLDTVSVTAADRAWAVTRLKRGAIFERRCARQAAKVARRAWADFQAGRYVAAEARFDRLLVWSPDDPAPRLGKLLALSRQDRRRDVEALAASMIHSGAGGVDVVASAEELLGDLAWRAGDLGAAGARYNAVLRSGAGEEHLRSAHAKLATLEYPAYREVLAPEAGVAQRAAVLATLADAGPEPALAAYLLGRGLYHERSWADAARLLSRAAADTLPDPSITAACLWLLGECHYWLGTLADAELAFQAIADLRRFEAEVVRADAWLARCRWRRLRQPAAASIPTDIEDRDPAETRSARQNPKLKTF